MFTLLISDQEVSIGPNKLSDSLHGLTTAFFRYFLIIVVTFYQRKLITNAFPERNVILAPEILNFQVNLIFVFVLSLVTFREVLQLDNNVLHH